MRVLLAPDCFGGTLTAVQAADAMTEGWRAARPDDVLLVRPMSDGGPGFLDVMPGDLHELTVEDPLARPVTAGYRLAGANAYVECAQACGLHLLTADERDPTVTTTYGVGQLVRAAAEAGATRIVLGLGGSATNDGGAGMLAALGVRREDAAGKRLDPGGLPLAKAARLVGVPLAVALVAATDVEAPLLGEHGASVVFGPQKGASPEQVQALDVALEHWADLLEAHLGVRVRDLAGAGAAGGLGAAVLAAGGTRVSGLELVAEAVGLAEAVREVDLVVTGEGSFDFSSLRGKVVSGVAAAAADEGRPCLVLAGQVSVGRRQAAAAGVEASYSLVDEVGLERALSHPHEALATLAGRVAGQWRM
ncbi:MAG: glycerate kinase [Frankiales bacterium]|nr:glycerate kinase [Frankiales bacterium]